MRIARHPRRAGDERLQSGADDAARLRGVRHLRGPEIFEKLRGIGQIGGHLEAVEESGLADRDGPDHPRLGGRRRADHAGGLRYLRGTHPARPRGGGTHRRACAAASWRLRGRGHRRRRGRAGRALPLDPRRRTSRSCSASTITPTSRARWSRMSTAIVGHRTQPHDPFDTGKIGTRAPASASSRAR